MPVVSGEAATMRLRRRPGSQLNDERSESGGSSSSHLRQVVDASVEWMDRSSQPLLTGSWKNAFQDGRFDFLDDDEDEDDGTVGGQSFADGKMNVALLARTSKLNLGFVHSFGESLKYDDFMTSVGKISDLKATV